jgi:hypothetical protein
MNARQATVDFLQILAGLQEREKESVISRQGLMDGTRVVRRDLMKAGAMAAIAGAVPLSTTLADPTERDEPVAVAFWPDGARPVIFVSLQIEGDAQPTSGIQGPMAKIDPKYPDLPEIKWYDQKGLSRLLEAFDRRKIKVLSV